MEKKIRQLVSASRTKVAAAVVVALLLLAAAFALALRAFEFEFPGSRRQAAATTLDAVLGATVEPLDPATAASLGISARDKGLVITSIGENGPAARAGIRAGDVIERIGGATVGSIGDAAAALKDAHAPDIILILNRHDEYVIVHLPAPPVARDPTKQGGER